MPHCCLQVPGHAVKLACSWGKTRAKDMGAAPEGAMSGQQVSPRCCVHVQTCTAAYGWHLLECLRHARPVPFGPCH